jgi:hypothetical protein
MLKQLLGELLVGVVWGFAIAAAGGPDWASMMAMMLGAVYVSRDRK